MVRWLHSSSLNISNCELLLLVSRSGNGFPASENWISRGWGVVARGRGRMHGRLLIVLLAEAETGESSLLFSGEWRRNGWLTRQDASVRICLRICLEGPGDKSSLSQLKQQQHKHSCGYSTNSISIHSTHPGSRRGCWNRTNTRSSFLSDICGGHGLNERTNGDRRVRSPFRRPPHTRNPHIHILSERAASPPRPQIGRGRSFRGSSPSHHLHLPPRLRPHPMPQDPFRHSPRLC